MGQNFKNIVNGAYRCGMNQCDYQAQQEFLVTTTPLD
jgi:hypothetical protein